MLKIHAGQAVISNKSFVLPLILTLNVVAPQAKTKLPTTSVLLSEEHRLEQRSISTTSMNTWTADVHGEPMLLMLSVSDNENKHLGCAADHL